MQGPPQLPAEMILEGLWGTSPHRPQRRPLLRRKPKQPDQRDSRRPARPPAANQLGFLCTANLLCAVAGSAKEPMKFIRYGKYVANPADAIGP